ncbi:MAG: hypothetical protein J5449_08830 [Oscillospiraceae bacterium]|nr:hypothetical protein [Oscillospiraceae bacterium]
MIAFPDARARQVNRVQNLVIILLALSAAFMFASLPLFGPLSDRSLLALAQEGIHRENVESAPDKVELPRLTGPVRIVYSNSFARLGSPSLTTLSDEFELAGTFLSEAMGSAGSVSPVRETVFLSALRNEGLYFDFGIALPSEVLAELLGVSLSGLAPDTVCRALLSPTHTGDAMLYVQDGQGRNYLFSTAVSSPALVEFLASRSGDNMDFAFMLGQDYSQLSPYTLVPKNPAPTQTLAAVNSLPGSEDDFLRRAGFSTHADNRFTESSGTVIVREIAGTLYLRTDGSVDYLGGAVEPDSLYFVPSETPGAPTFAEAALAAQRTASVLLRDMLGDAELCLSGIQGRGEHYEVTFDLLANGAPIRLSNGSHTAVVTINGQSVTALSLKPRRYTLTENSTLLLPFAQASAIARVLHGAELNVAYVDSGGEEVAPAWIAD